MLRNLFLRKTPSFSKAFSRFEKLLMAGADLDDPRLLRDFVYLSALDGFKHKGIDKNRFVLASYSCIKREMADFKKVAEEGIVLTDKHAFTLDREDLSHITGIEKLYGFLALKKN